MSALDDYAAERPPGTVEEFEKRRFLERVQDALDRLAELQIDPPKPCPHCKHQPYPIVGVQHCWCDPSEEEE